MRFKKQFKPLLTANIPRLFVKFNNHCMVTDMCIVREDVSEDNTQSHLFLCHSIYPGKTKGVTIHSN